MSSTYSPDLRIELIGTGDQAGVWGATTNNNMAYVLEQAIAGYVSVAVSSANQALTYLNGATATAADNQSVHASIALTTSTGANFTVYAPPVSKQYTIYNASSYTATISNSNPIGSTTATGGTTVAIPAGKTMTVWSDGTNFSQQNTHLISPTIASPTLTTPALGTPSSGTLTNATGLPIATGVSGLGTGVATALAVNVGSAGAPVLFNGALGTPSSGTLTNATGLPIVNGTTGTLSVARGGTGATSFTSGALLKGAGTGAIAVASASDIVGQIGSTAVQNATNATNATTAANGGVTSVNGQTGAVDTTTFGNIGSICALYCSYNAAFVPGDTVTGSYLFYAAGGSNYDTSTALGGTYSPVSLTSFVSDGTDLRNRTTSIVVGTGANYRAMIVLGYGTWRCLSGNSRPSYDGCTGTFWGRAVFVRVS